MIRIVGLKALLLVVVMLLAACSSESGDVTREFPTDPTDPNVPGSSTWDEMIWDQDNWA